MSRSRPLLTASPILLLAMLLAASIFAPHSAHAGEPVLRTTPTAFDFGDIPKGYKVTCRYWLVNDGDDTLVVSKVKPQCGCTTVPLVDDHLAPGDSTPLDLSFNSEKFTGRVNKLVRIYSNDSTQNPAKIYFTARVGEPDTGILVDPPFVDFENIDKTSQVISLKNRESSLYTVSVRSVPPYIDWRLSADTLAPGQEVRLSLAPGKDTPLGLYETSLTLWFSGRDAHPVTIPIRGIGYMR